MVFHALKLCLHMHPQTFTSSVGKVCIQETNLSKRKQSAARLSKHFAITGAVSWVYGAEAGPHTRTQAALQGFNCWLGRHDPDSLH